MHLAFYKNSVRRRLATDHDDHIYEAVRDAQNRSERIVTIFNFSDQRVAAVVDTAAIASMQAKDLQSGEQVRFNQRGTEFKLPAYSWRRLQVHNEDGK